MAPEGPVYQAGTLSGNPLAMAAGLATLRELAKPGTYKRLGCTSQRLADGLGGLAAEEGVDLISLWMGGLFGFFFHAGIVMDFEGAKAAHEGRFRRFFSTMLAQGVYLAPSPYECGFASLAHRPSDVDATLEAARIALRRAGRVA